MAGSFTSNGSNKIYNYLEGWVGNGLAYGSGSSTAKAEYNSISNKDALVTGSFSGGSFVHSKTGYVIGAFAVTQSNGTVANYMYVRPSAGAAPLGVRLDSCSFVIDPDRLHISFDSQVSSRVGTYEYDYHEPEGTLTVRSSPSNARLSVTKR